MLAMRIHVVTCVDGRVAVVVTAAKQGSRSEQYATNNQREQIEIDHAPPTVGGTLSLLIA